MCSVSNMFRKYFQLGFSSINYSPLSSESSVELSEILS
jgi:hypothetical protein